MGQSYILPIIQFSFVLVSPKTADVLSNNATITCTNIDNGFRMT